MSDNLLTVIFLALAGCIVPAAYLSLCVWMFRRRVWWFTYFAYFCLFGAFGGWCFAFAVSPSGLTSASIIFLVTVVLAACLISALVLQFRKQKSRFEKVAMVGGYAYPLLIIAYFLNALVFYHAA
jgi:hypothetical protein